MKEREELKQYMKELSIQHKAICLDQILEWWPTDSEQPEAIAFWKAIGECRF